MYNFSNCFQLFYQESHNVTNDYLCLITECINFPNLKPTLKKYTLENNTLQLRIAMLCPRSRITFIPSVFWMHLEKHPQNKHLSGTSFLHLEDISPSVAGSLNASPNVALLISSSQAAYLPHLYHTSHSISLCLAWLLSSVFGEN